MSKRFILSAALADRRVNSPEWAREKLRSLEAAGVDMVVLGEPDRLPFDAIVIASWAAPLTHGMGIVPCVTTGLGHPFHAARALSAIDFLSGGLSGWNPAPTHGDPADKATDFASAARALWDGWSANTMIIDKTTGRYLDASTVRVPHYVGPFYKVRGPVNAARPLQGHPVMVVDASASFTLPGIDVALTSNPASAPEAEKVLLKLNDSPDIAQLEALFTEGSIDGVHLALECADELLASVKVLAAQFGAERPVPPKGSSLRDRLGLPSAPEAIRLGEAA